MNYSMAFSTIALCRSKLLCLSAVYTRIFVTRASLNSLFQQH